MQFRAAMAYMFLLAIVLHQQRMWQLIRKNEQQQNRRRRRRRIWPIWLLLLIGLGGLSYYAYSNPAFITSIGAANYLPESVAGFLQQQPPEETSDEDVTLASSPVRRGDISITAFGIGSILPTNEVNLSFGSSGDVTHVLVKVGDTVTQGQTLAQINDKEVRLQIMQTGTDLRTAEIDLAALSNSDNVAEVASAQATLASAQAALNQLLEPPDSSQLSAARNELLSAQQALAQLQTGPSADEQTSLQADLRQAEVAVQLAQRAYDKIAWRNDVGATSQSAALQDATIAYERSKAQYNLSAVGPSADQISAAQARIDSAAATLNALQKGPAALDVTAAQANVTEAQARLSTLTAGADPNEVEVATINLTQLQNTMQARMEDLRGVVILSPVNGVITAVDISVGEQAGTSPVISVIERDSTQIRFWLDELDAGIVTLGNPVDILFEAFPDYTFTGEVARIEPSLVTVDGASAVQMWSTIDMNEHPVNLLYGMNVEVEVTAGETEGALLIPVQALRELTPGLSTVFVVDESGELEMRPVEVGLRDFVNVEILSGVGEGEQVSTGDIALQ